LLESGTTLATVVPPARAAHVAQGLGNRAFPIGGLVDMRRARTAGTHDIDEDQAGSRQKDDRVRPGKWPDDELR